MGRTWSLDQLLVLSISLVLGTIIMGNMIPILIMIGLTLLYTEVINKFKLPSLAQGMSTTFVPVGMYIFQ